MASLYESLIVSRAMAITTSVDFAKNALTEKATLEREQGGRGSATDGVLTGELDAADAMARRTFSTCSLLRT